MAIRGEKPTLEHSVMMESKSVDRESRSIRTNVPALDRSVHRVAGKRRVPR